MGSGLVGKPVVQVGRVSSELVEEFIAGDLDESFASSGVDAAL